MQKRVMIWGVGSFAHSMMKIFKDTGAEVGCYLTRDYGHYGPVSTGPTWTKLDAPTPIKALQEFQPDVIVPMSIAWHKEPWAEEFMRMNIPIFCPTEEAIRIEVERFYTTELCKKYNIPVPCAYQANNRLEAMSLMEVHPLPYVLKNPLCSPFSPVHTIVCETVEETIGWLKRIDYAEGLFLQEYLGVIEAGHFVFVSDGEIYSIATNQEYKRAFTGNMGPVAGAPLGGIVEQDPEDKYGLAKNLIHPIRPWLKETGFHGPLQVTAMQKEGQWYSIEYNVRLGVTSGAMFLRMMENPLDVILDVSHNRKPLIKWKKEKQYGCSLTLAGYGYPFIIPMAPQLPVSIEEPLRDCDLWWNEVDEKDDQLFMVHHEAADMGHRIADLTACDTNLDSAIKLVYENIHKIRCLGSYYRLDIGKSLWPPGTGY